MLSRVSVRASVRAYSSAPVKVVSRDASGSLSTLSAVVSNSGSKTGKAGAAHLLSKFAFLNTNTKSALRLARESELLGGSYSAHVTRDAIVLKTQFLKSDLPYYVDALASALAQPSFRPHEFTETVLPVARAEAAAAQANSAFVGLEQLHALTFRKGLGQPLYYSDAQPVTFEDVTAFASDAYTQGNVHLVASGVNSQDLAGFVAGSAFSELKQGATSSPKVSTRTGGETRIASKGTSYAAIAVPVAPKDFAQYEVLAAAAGTSTLTGAKAPLAQIPGANAKLYKYQDAGLFVVSVKGADGHAVANGIRAAKNAVTSISASDLTNATKAAQLSVALQESFEFPHNNAVKADTANGFKGASLEGFNYVAVGHIDVLPYADEL